MRLSPLQDVWRVVKDVDLAGIRSEAQRLFELAIVAEDSDLADALAVALAGQATDGRFAHPNLRLLHADEGWPALPATPLATLLVSSEPALSGTMAALRGHLVRHGAPVVTVVIGHGSPAADEPRDGEWTRVAVAALDDKGAPERIARRILTAIPRERHVAVARALPPFRAPVATTLIDETARVNATYAFTTGLAETVPLLTAPMVVGDMVILTKNQLVMCYRIVLAHGHDGEPRALMGEIASVLGGGLLFRQAARQLVGLVPGLGLIPKVAMAYAGTWAVGRAMTTWARTGRSVTAAAVRRYAREGVERGRLLARTLRDGRQLGDGPAPSRFGRIRARLRGR